MSGSKPPPSSVARFLPPAAACDTHDLVEGYHLCPDLIRDAIKGRTALDDPGKDLTEAIKGNLARIAVCMKDYLAELDTQIDHELGCTSSLQECKKTR